MASKFVSWSNFRNSTCMAPRASVVPRAERDNSDKKLNKGKRKTIGSKSNRTAPGAARTETSTSRTKSPQSPRQKQPLGAHPFRGWDPRRVDGALVMGDIWAVALTQSVSDRIPWPELPLFQLIAVLAWITTAYARRDYTSGEELAEEGGWLLGWSVYAGILQACFTWLFFTPLLMLAYAALASHGLLYAEPVMAAIPDGRVPAVLQVDVVLLITITAWRGSYYAFRDGLIR